MQTTLLGRCGYICNKAGRSGKATPAKWLWVVIWPAPKVNKIASRKLVYRYLDSCDQTAFLGKITDLGRLLNIIVDRLLAIKPYESLRFFVGSESEGGQIINDKTIGSVF
ncbi:hypothetical protein K443DRAFT_337150 [Laccaria amethystina LaAM-08-1]|jgi:hypothetical protein|uniref:Uncharacterized protein n=1 Tax=Laccaria amethystina LaAM-08-1 TaxID=1095629 RepID=A0A0C9XGB0_9AGAR|nr:hypothetical protein K443DRAFT_337150 [Laccaria amethystina LaAM-08-1]